MVLNMCNIMLKTPIYYNKFMIIIFTKKIFLPFFKKDILVIDRILVLFKTT